MQTEGNLLYEQPKVSYTSFQPERTGQQLCEQELGEMMLSRGHLWLRALWKARHNVCQAVVLTLPWICSINSQFLTHDAYPLAGSILFIFLMFRSCQFFLSSYNRSHCVLPSALCFCHSSSLYQSLLLKMIVLYTIWFSFTLYTIVDLIYVRTHTHRCDRVVSSSRL